MNLNLSKNMSKNLITVSEKMQVAEALMIMKSHHFRHLPIINSTNEIVGIVSDRDLYKALNSDEVELSQIMIKDIYKFDIKTNMKDIVDKMIKLKISAFLVTQDGETAGIITSEDMLQLLAQLLSETSIGMTRLEEFLQAANDITKGLSKAVKNPYIV